MEAVAAGQPQEPIFGLVDGEADPALVTAVKAWAWAEQQGLEVISSEWNVRTVKYGWQDAYNMIVRKEGQDWEPENEFRKYVCQALGRSTFEAEGQASRITLEKMA